jgi:hypothetical protein
MIEGKKIDLKTSKMLQMLAARIFLVYECELKANVFQILDQPEFFLCKTDIYFNISVFVIEIGKQKL